MLQLCRRKRLGDGDNLRLFTDLVTGEEAVDVNCTDDRGRNPLMLLCRYNQSDSLYNCIEILLQQRHDIDLKQTDKDGMNALMHLCRDSISDRIVQVAILLIDNDIDVNQVDKEGKNALMWLCAHSENDKSVEVTQFLITNEIDVKHTDNEGRNSEGHLDVNTFLLDSKKRAMLDLLQQSNDEITIPMETV